jgi:hypothetical protein
MRIEDREEFIDHVAQAVIDKIEERDRIEGMVSLVVARVLILQKGQAQATSLLAEAAHSHKDGAAESLSERSSETSPEENTHVEQS